MSITSRSPSPTLDHEAAVRLRELQAQYEAEKKAADVKKARREQERKERKEQKEHERKEREEWEAREWLQGYRDSYDSIWGPMYLYLR